MQILKKLYWKIDGGFGDFLEIKHTYGLSYKIDTPRHIT